MAEAILIPRPGYSLKEAVENPNEENAVIYVYEHGRIIDILPATRASLYLYKPKPPPEYYKKETVEGIPIAKEFPEKFFGVGSSPFVQAMYKKATLYRSVTLLKLYKTLVDEYRILPAGRKTLITVKKLLDWHDKNTGYIVKTRQKTYIAGMPPPVEIPLIPFTPGMNPIEEQICKLAESQHFATFDDFVKLLLHELRWLTDTSYLRSSLQKLVKEGCLRIFAPNVYEFLKYPKTF